MVTVSLGHILLWTWLLTATQAAFRLPSTLTPTQYVLQLTPSLSTFSYTGTVQITFQTSSNAAENALKSVSLHKDSSVLVDYSQISLHVTNSTQVTMTIHNDTYEADTQVYTLNLQTAMTAGTSYTMIIPFSGTLRKDYTGLYVGSFTYNNITSYYMATNLYPIYARLVFPCFDEPHFKATFEVRVVRSRSQFTLSNKYEHSTVEMANAVEDVFQVTPEMSVHSLSIFVANNWTIDFLYTTADTGTTLLLVKPKQLEINFYTSPFSSLNNFQSYLEQLIQTKYPLTYLQFVVLPDLQYDAFGGFGMIFLKKEAVQPYQGLSIQQQVDTYLIILEQMARQFVSNYLTPAWWSDIWLTEGLAVYLKYLVFYYVINQSGHLNPDQMLAVSIRQKALSLDLQEYESYPLVESDITTTARILRAVSDDVKKYKGAAVYFMMEQSYSGMPTKTLITYFLAQKGYSTILTSEFLEQVSATNKNFIGMNSWFTAAGYPTVALSRNGSNFFLSQKKVIGLTNTNSTSSSWRVPITYTSLFRPSTEWIATSAKNWFNSSTFNGTTTAATTEWMIFNLRSAGFYRVQYETADLQLIKNQLKSNSYRIDSINHASIIDDLMALLATDSVSFETALKFLQETSSHTRYYPWLSTINALNFLKLSLYNQPAYSNFKTYVQGLLHNVYEYVGFFGYMTEAKNVTLLRNLILPMACEFEVGDCVRNSSTIMELVTSELKSTKAGTIYNVDQNMCQAFKNINASLFKTFFDYYKSNNPKIAFQYYVASGLGCVTNDNLQIILTSLLNGSIYAEDVDKVFTSTYSVTENVETVLNFIVVNAPALQQKYGTAFIQKVIKGIGSQLYSETQLNNLSTLNSTTTDLSSTIASVITHAKPRITWASKNNATLTTVLNVIVNTKSSATVITQSAILLVLTFIISHNKLCNF